MKLGQILQLAASDVGLGEGTPVSPDVYAAAALRRLHEAGYAIHALDGRCVRIAGDPPGRPATEDELRALLAEAGK